MAQDAALDEHEAGRAALGARRGDGLLDGLAVGEAEVHDDLADHARRAPGVLRRVEARVAAATGRARLGPAVALARLTGAPALRALRVLRRRLLGPLGSVLRLELLLRGNG